MNSMSSPMCEVKKQPQPKSKFNLCFIHVRTWSPLKSKLQWVIILIWVWVLWCYRNMAMKTLNIDTLCLLCSLLHSKMYLYVGQGQREKLYKGNQIQDSAPSPSSSNDSRAWGRHREATHFQVDRERKKSESLQQHWLKQDSSISHLQGENYL